MLLSALHFLLLFFALLSYSFSHCSVRHEKSRKVKIQWQKYFIYQRLICHRVFSLWHTYRSLGIKYMLWYSGDKNTQRDTRNVCIYVALPGRCRSSISVSVWQVDSSSSQHFVHYHHVKKHTHKHIHTHMQPTKWSFQKRATMATLILIVMSLGFGPRTSYGLSVSV